MVNISSPLCSESTVLTGVSSLCLDMLERGQSWQLRWGECSMDKPVGMVVSSLGFIDMAVDLMRSHPVEHLVALTGIAELTERRWTFT